MTITLPLSTHGKPVKVTAPEPTVPVTELPGPSLG